MHKSVCVRQRARMRSIVFITLLFIMCVRANMFILYDRSLAEEPDPQFLERSLEGSPVNT